MEKNNKDVLSLTIQRIRYGDHVTAMTLYATTEIGYPTNPE